MPIARIYPSALKQAGLVSLQQFQSAGVSEQHVRTLIRRSEITRVVRVVYLVHKYASDAFDDRRARAALAGLLAVAPKGISTGLCALHLHRVQGLPLSLVPEVALTSGNFAPGVAGVKVRQFTQPFDWWWVGEWRVAAPVPAFVQAMPHLGLPGAVVALDSALTVEPSILCR